MKSGVSECPKCGTNNKRGSSFCMKCGSELGTQLMNTENKMEKKNRKLFWVLSLAIVFVFVVIVMTNRKAVIELNNYVVINFEGYDGYGRAATEINWDKLETDYAEKFSKKSTLTGDFDMLLVDLKRGAAEGKLTKDRNLVNGEKIVFEWGVVAEEMKEKFNIELVYSDIECEVSGLQEVKVVDPFENLNVNFYGTSPLGEASIEGMADTYGNGIFFELDKIVGLANGDVVTLKAEYTMSEEELTNRQGIKLGATEKQFTVTGLDEYVASVEDIDEELFEKMKAEGKDEYLADAAGWAEGQNIEEMTYIGNYFLYAKNQQDAQCHNRVCMVYKIVASDNYPESGQVGNFEFYAAMNFDNIINTTEGESLVDLEGCYYSPGSFERTINTGHRYWDSTFLYYGFKDMDTLFRKSVVAYGDNFMYEAHME